MTKITNKPKMCLAETCSCVNKEDRCIHLKLLLFLFDFSFDMTKMLPYNTRRQQRYCNYHYYSLATQLLLLALWHYAKQLLTWQSFSSFLSFLCSGSGGLLGRYFSLSAGEMEFRCEEKEAILLKSDLQTHSYSSM